MTADTPDTGPTGQQTEGALEAGRKFGRGEINFVLGAAEDHQIPATTLPEVAFAGRSNVGKSSLINALFERKALARTSNTPGRTREVNFFEMPGRLMLADLPGYGYARAPKTEIARWTHLINAYLKGRQPLRRVFVLIDSRHGLKTSDTEIMKMLDTAAVSYQVVLTKADKIKPPALAKRRAETEKVLKAHAAAHPRVIATSAQKGTGLDELRAELAMLAQPAEAG